MRDCTVGSIVAFALCSVLLVGCGKPEGPVPRESLAAFKARLYDVVGDHEPETWSSVVCRPPFREVVEHAHAWVPLVLEVLASPEFPENLKTAAVLAMGQLGDDDYIRFCESVVEGVERGRVSLEQAGFALFPSSPWCLVLRRNYADPRVRRLMATYSARDPDWQESIRDLLSGKSWRNTCDLMAEGQIDSWWPCDESDQAPPDEPR